MIKFLVWFGLLPGQEGVPIAQKSVSAQISSTSQKLACLAAAAVPLIESVPLADIGLASDPVAVPVTDNVPEADAAKATIALAVPLIEIVPDAVPNAPTAADAVPVTDNVPDAAP